MKIVTKFNCVVLLLVLTILTGCTKQVDEKRIVKYRTDNGISFLQVGGNLFGWSEEKTSSSLIYDLDFLQFDDVESFEFQKGDSEILYLKKNDGTFWMMGYDENASKRQQHNYKELTMVMDDVKTFFTRPGLAVYVLKNDNSLWYWEKGGTVRKGRKIYSFFKVMNDVKSVTVGGGIDYAIRTDNSLWSINVYGLTYFFSPYASRSEKLIDNVGVCRVAYSDVYESHVAYAIDNDRNLWTWGMLFENGEFVSPRIIMKDIVDVTFFSNIEQNPGDQFALKADGSFWRLTDVIPNSEKIYGGWAPRMLKDKPEKIFKNTKKFFILSESKGVIILDDKNELWLIDDKEQLIAKDVVDFAPIFDGETVWVFKNDNTLVDQNGKVHLENVEGIYTNAELFDEGLAISDGKVYALKADGVKEVFDLESRN